MTLFKKNRKWEWEWEWEKKMGWDGIIIKKNINVSQKKS